MNNKDIEEVKAYEKLAAAAVEHGLDVFGGEVRRTSSRFCLGVEHGDYNGTELLGVGTDRYIWVAYRANGRAEHRMYSCNFPADGVVCVPCGRTGDAERAADRARDKTGRWGHFVRGVDYVLRAAGIAVTAGIDAVVYGNIPGGGMSRSASLTVNLICSVCAAQPSADAAAPAPMRVAELSQAVENDYIGAPCGCLDQVMIVFAQAGCATRFDPATKTVSHVRFGSDKNSSESDDSFRLLVLDTGTTRHGLDVSTYSLRVAECRKLCAVAGLRALADVKTPEQLAAVRARVADSTVALPPAEQAALLARLQYIYDAQHNFARMVEAWAAGDIATVGRLFRADGIGLRDQYCISGPELEAMCDIARTVPGVHGERMLGGGDKGAAGLLCAPDAVAAVRAAVATSYPRGHPLYADKWAVHECRFVQGITVLPGLVSP